MLDYVIDNENEIIEKCTYNLVIHKNANCYFENINDLENYIKTISDIKYYYMIAHTKAENGIVDKHYHVILCYTRKTSVAKVKKYFIGAHIEETGNKQASIQYLVHRTAKAKMQNKEIYNYQDIITNNKVDNEKFIALDIKIESEENGTFYQDTGEVVAILTDNALLQDFELSTIELIKKYGSKQVKQKMPIINQLRKENVMTSYEELKERYNALEKKIDNLQSINESLMSSLDKDLPF